MKSYYEREAECAMAFSELGECWHLSTSENFEIIFYSEDDYKAGMGILAICARLFPEARILTFEWMSNHLHITASAAKERLIAFVEAVKRMLLRYLISKGRTVDIKAMTYNIHILDSLERIRNVIAYDNRNGYLVHPEHTPFSYPWGANRFYFNSDAKRLATDKSRQMTFREIRAISHTHKTDGLKDILSFDGYALPLDFCDILTGEQLFRDPAHYFFLISRNIESNKHIAKEIGESVFYTDNELFSAIARTAREKYGCATLLEATPSAKLELAKMMRYDYNASTKQIIRFLKLSHALLNSIGIR